MIYFNHGDGFLLLHALACCLQFILLIGLGTGWLNQYRLYSGKNQSVYWTAAIYWPSEARPRAPPRLVRGPRWRRRRTPKQYHGTHFRFISHHNRSSKLCWPGVVAVMYTEKIKNKSIKIRDVLHVGVCAGWCIINRCDVSYLIFNVIRSLLPLGQRVVGSRQQTKHKKAETNQYTKTKQKTIRKTKER